MTTRPKTQKKSKSNLMPKDGLLPTKLKYSVKGIYDASLSVYQDTSTIDHEQDAKIIIEWMRSVIPSGTFEKVVEILVVKGAI